MRDSRLSRRAFLKTSAMATATVALAACVAPQAGAPQAGAAQPAKQGLKLHFFNRGGEYVFQTMDLQINEFKKTHPEYDFELDEVAGFSHQ